LTNETFKANAMAFFKAVAIGGIAGGGPFMLLTVPLGIDSLIDSQVEVSILEAVYVMALPVLISIPVVLAFSIVIGLPLTIAFCKAGVDKGAHYVAAGTIFGAAPFVVASTMTPDATPLLVLSVFGALAGSASGWTWGRHRDEVTKPAPEP
jgi:hypothetical protein